MDWKFLVFAFLFASFVYGQKDDTTKEQIEAELNDIDLISDADLEIFDTINLSDANVLHLNLRTDMEKKYYIWLRRRVRDVWPYVKVAVEEYNSIQDTSMYFKNNKERKKYIKKRQQLLADEFEEKLKNLSLSRGQILIKLINRETGKTANDIIKELRGGVNAFIWRSAGGAFDLDLKAEFDPHRIREDLYIEVILQKDFQSGRLERIRELE